MELSSLLQDLHPAPSEKPRPCQSLPLITELLSGLQEKLIGASSNTETLSLIGRVECLFRTADPLWLFAPDSDNQDGGWAELREAYSSVVCALIGCAALPLCKDDSGCLPTAAYRSCPGRAGAVCSALTTLLGTLGNGGATTDLLLAVAPPVCVFAVTHFQVRVE